MSCLLAFHDLINELQSHEAADEEDADLVSETEPEVVALVMSKTAPTPVVADKVTGLVKLTNVKGLTEAEIIRTMLKVLKPATFKDMLITKDSLTVAELKQFHRAGLRNQSNTELLHDPSTSTV